MISYAILITYIIILCILILGIIRQNVIIENVPDNNYEELYRLAYYDIMTNSYNRNWLEGNRKELDKICQFITIVDINELKVINDSEGHKSGDDLLIKSANKLLKLGTVIRLGGDEFLILSEKDITSDLQKYEEISYGSVFKTGDISLKVAMCLADNLMYINKRTYYEKNNKRNI